MIKENAVNMELLEEINTLPVVDTHEHLMPESMRTDGKVDFFNIAMAHYASSDMISAGMSDYEMGILRDDSTSIEKKTEIFMPFWKKTSNTTYCSALKIAARDLYGIDQIDESTLPELNKRVIERNQPGIYKEILQDRLNIKYCIWDQFWLDNPQKDDFFRLALRLDEAIWVNEPNDIKNLENKYNVSISSPSDIEEIMEVCITNHKTRGLTALKSGLAYNRTLQYEHVSRTEAILALDKILRNRFLESDAKIVQDYLMYSMVEKAYWHNLTVQIHTGHQEGNGNDIRNSNPSLLSDLIINNPHTRFDLFHGGYPYGGELSAMAKMFPNVYLDMSWLHVISPEYSRRYLKEWLDTVPVSKILGFGGDYIFVEGVYGHLMIARKNIAAALGDKVADGYYSMDEAKSYARMMLYDNPNRLFTV